MAERVLTLKDLKAIAEETVAVRRVLDGNVVTHELMQRNMAELIMSNPPAATVRSAKIQTLEDYLQETT